MNRRPLLWGGSVLTVLLLLWFLYLARSVVIPLLLALLLAYFLDPAADALERRRVPRSLAVGLVFTAFLLVAVTVLAFLLPALKEEMARLQQIAPRYAENLYRLLPGPLLDWLGIGGEQDLQTLFGRAMEAAKNLSFDVIGQVAIFLTRAFSSTLSFLLAVLGYFIIPIYLFYLLRDFDRIKGGTLALVPPRFREGVTALAGDVDQVMGGFIRGQLTVCLILAALYSAGLLLIGIDLALLIGILSGLAFIIPYLGTILGILLAGIMAAVKFHDLLHPAMVVGWFALVQGLEGTVITPRIVGDRVGLHPLATILAVLTGGELFGFLGLLLAVPVVASANVVLKRLVTLYRQSELFDPAEAGKEG